MNKKIITTIILTGILATMTGCDHTLKGDNAAAPNQSSTETAKVLTNNNGQVLPTLQKP